MTQQEVPSAVTLVVINGECLEGRSTSSHVFSEDGGRLGSGQADDWLLQDPEGKVQTRHAEILLIDGRFCLIDRSGRTFINHATLPIGRDRRVALREGDELAVGDYRLRVHLGDRHSWETGTRPLNSLVSGETELLEADSRLLAHAPKWTEQDPMTALHETSPGGGEYDPLKALSAVDEEDRTASPSLLDDVERPRKTTFGTDATGRGATAMHMPAIQRYEGDKAMDEQQLDDLERSVGEQLEDRWQEPTMTSSPGHVGAESLQRAMGAELAFRDSAEQEAFIGEAGRTLRAAIEGLQALHRFQDESRYPLRDRRLQPIEDNPLRLDQTYQDTVETLFSSRRSPVHLSGPAAVTECLEQQRQHQDAVEAAISEGLRAILAAFSPDALLKRFHAYRGSREGEGMHDAQGWAWDMYRHYYQELSSGRQQGFEKLFWEVFEQAYDQSVRQQQQEGA
ncbi:type VI secretion system-associated FHA domain protein TagH [Aidingimonas halophila]|uniref:FHA domain protein n=1 Tax=Aidingimonas halophila TaxID=574349 RepID=A0A1H2ZJN0_9GAMM|nr:type VI secretion system-associated FHA domain protein TagH [Aidingimonas halophila]GHC16192.1 type VI secretion protein [Aidingimonas halophila]SDX17575.1 FHA domain protein [Aidingimonas halophila]